LGGIETPFFFFYLIYAVIACFLFSKSRSFAYAGLINSLYLGLIILEATEAIPHYNLVGFRSPLRFQQAAHIVVSSLSLASPSFLIVYFTTSIVARLREREKDLTESNLACELRTRELAEANTACEIKTQELWDANYSCEVKTRELEEKTYELEIKTKELAELNSRLEKLDKARVQFIWLVTHELRAPIAGIQSYLRLILDGYIPAERQYEIIQKVERLAMRHLNLISDLLQLASLRDSESINNMELARVDVSEILNSVMDMMNASATEKDIQFGLQIEPDITPIKANTEHIKQLWTNLISNAIKYTESGGKVSVSLSQNSDHILGMVQDTGIGIAPEDLPYIFNDFFRAKNAKSNEKDGTGLGLAIVKRIIETYKGEIYVESEPGIGTKFTFAIPKSSRLPLVPIEENKRILDTDKTLRQ